MSEDLKALLLSVPKGFRVVREEDEILHIKHKHTGMGSSVLFLLVWLTGWTAGLLFTLPEIFSSFLLDNLFGYLYQLPFMLIGEIVVASMLIWIFLGRTHFILTEARLQVTKRLFIWSKSRMFLMEEIKGFTLVQDGGLEDDFPSWGLVVDAEESVKILSRQDPSKSLWLGEMLGRWSGKAFHRNPDHDYEAF